MRRNLLGLAFVVLVFGGAGLALFGARSPCDGMRAAAARLADEMGGETGAPLRRRLVEASPERLGTAQCISTTVSIKLRGRDALVVVDR